MSTIRLTEAKALAFDTILDKIRQSGLHGKSPTFFVIYAHDNDSLGLDAHQDVVKDYISWFKAILLNVVSDKSPHGTILETARDDASDDIISNQLCLLPSKWNQHSVDYVLVFYSKLLARYMKDERAFTATTVKGDPLQNYLDAIFQVCTEHDKQRLDGYQKACEAKIRLLQKTYSDAMGDKFHHVLTELALLRFRNRGRVPSYTIPILLGEEANWGADYQWKGRYLEMTETEIRVPVSLGDLYRSFFKILLRFETLKGDRPLIEKFLACFEKSVAAHSLDMTATDFKTQLAANIFEVYRSLHEGQVYQLKKPMMVGSLRDILDVYARDCAALKRVSGDDLPPGLNDIELEISQDAKLLDYENEEAKQDSYDEEVEIAQRAVPPSQKENDTKQNSHKERPESEKVSLCDLFNKRKVGNMDIQPYRVFVRGKPGVGKSTLCRRIMHDYSLHNELRAKFELVVLIPVRKLDTDLSNILFTEYFRAVENGRNISQFLQDLILDSREVTKVPKIMVILDGLDEARGWEPRKRILLERLLRLPAVLVTSRTTDDAGSIHFDLRLDAVGLSMDSVTAFLDNRDIIPSSTAKAIQHLIGINSAVREIVRVPIYLDIICSGWGEGSDADHGKQPTMTALYQGVMHSLWRKDIPRLHKLDHGELVTDETVQAVMDTSRLERVVEAEVMVLEQIAITMMVRNQLEFTGRYISTAVRRMESIHGRMPLSLEKNLATLSILRSSSAHYRFVHPTFQEFFAAKYIARDLDRIKAYMKSHKYHPRFDMIWRFVAGLLSESAHLPSFFDILGQEPLDLLGPTHQRMVMRCLNEIDPKTKMPIRPKLEKSLESWLLFDCLVNYESHMLAEADVPMSVLYSVLKAGGLKAGGLITVGLLPTILRSLASSRAHFSTEIVLFLFELINRVTFQEYVVTALGSQANLPEKAVLRLVPKLMGSLFVRSRAAQALVHQTSLSDDAVAAIIGLLGKSKKMDVAEIINYHPGFPDKVVAAAKEILDSRYTPSNMSDEVVLSILEELKHKLPNEKPPGLGAILQRTDLCDQAIQVLLELLTRSNFPRFAETALSRQTNLPDDAIRYLTEMFQHVDGVAVHILKKANKSDRVVSILMELIEHGSTNAQRCSSVLLRSCASDLSDTVLETLVGLLKNEDNRAVVAAYVLEARGNLPDSVVSALVEVIISEGSARHLCAEVLGMQEHLSDRALTALKKLLNDSAQPVRAAAVIAFIKHGASLQDPVSSAIVDLLGTIPSLEADRDYSHGLPPFRRVAAALSTRTDPLPNEVVTALETLLGTKILSIQTAAVIGLRHQTVSERAVHDLVDLLYLHKPISIKWYEDNIPLLAATVLREQKLESWHYFAIAMHLRCSSIEVEALRRSTMLTDKFPGYIGLSLESESETVGETPCEEEPREEPPASTVCDIETIDAWYGVWLLRSFEERYVLYVEDDAGPGEDRPPKLCLSQPSGLRTARFKDMGDYKRFLRAIERGRKRWNAPVVEKTEQKQESSIVRWIGHK